MLCSDLCVKFHAFIQVISTTFIVILVYEHTYSIIKPSTLICLPTAYLLICIVYILIKCNYTPDTPDTTATPDITCPDHSEKVGSECFSMSNSKLSWEEAQLNCNEMGGKLAEPSNVTALHDFFFSEISNFMVLFGTLSVSLGTSWF